MCIKEQAPLLNSTFRQTLIFLLSPKCANGLYSGLCEAVRTALKWSVLVELDRLRYSQTSLIWRPKGQNQVSALQRCPRESMVFGISGTKRTVRNREVSVRRGYTVSVFFGHEKGNFTMKLKPMKIQ